MGHYHDALASGAIFGYAICVPFASSPLTHQKPLKTRLDIIRAWKRPANTRETEASLCTHRKALLEDNSVGMTKGMQETGLLTVAQATPGTRFLGGNTMDQQLENES